MGMTDRQFDSYHARLVKTLEKILEVSGDDCQKLQSELKKLIDEIKTELKRP